MTSNKIYFEHKWKLWSENYDENSKTFWRELGENFLSNYSPVFSAIPKFLAPMKKRENLNENVCDQHQSHPDSRAKII
jgi:hypothetical protein